MYFELYNLKYIYKLYNLKIHFKKLYNSKF